MRKIIILFISLFCLNANAITPLSGKFINSKGELSFTFIGDSLYIDCANSGCGISAFKLIPNKRKGKMCCTTMHLKLIWRMMKMFTDKC